MEPLGILYGYVSFFGLKKALNTFKKPLRKAAVYSTSQMFNVLDHTKETAYNIKEEFEDIIAEAQYENMKRKKGFVDKGESS